MELIPMEHQLNETIEANLTLASLYETAGMKSKALDLRQQATIDVCKTNSLTICRADDVPCGICQTTYGICDYTGQDWTLIELDLYIGDVPHDMLLKMATIQEKERLMVGVPIVKYISDPVLFFKLPYLNDCYIEIARWE